MDASASRRIDVGLSDSDNDDDEQDASVPEPARVMDDDTLLRLLHHDPSRAPLPDTMAFLSDLELHIQQLERAIRDPCTTPKQRKDQYSKLGQLSDLQARMATYVQANYDDLAAGRTPSCVPATAAASSTAVVPSRMTPPSVSSTSPVGHEPFEDDLATLQAEYKMYDEQVDMAPSPRTRRAMVDARDTVYRRMRRLLTSEEKEKNDEYVVVSSTQEAVEMSAQLAEAFLAALHDDQLVVWTAEHTAELTDVLSRHGVSDNLLRCACLPFGVQMWRVAHDRWRQVVGRCGSNPTDVTIDDLYDVIVELLKPANVAAALNTVVEARVCDHFTSSRLVSNIIRRELDTDPSFVTQLPALLAMSV